MENWVLTIILFVAGTILTIFGFFLRTAYMDLPSNEDVRKKMNENWKVYDFMQTAQVPSEELLSQFWIHSSDNAKELPLEK